MAKAGPEAAGSARAIYLDASVERFFHAPTFNAGRHICKFYVDIVRQVSEDDGAYDGGCCRLPTTALITSRRPPGEVSSPFPAHIGASAGCRLVPTGVL